MHSGGAQQFGQRSQVAQGVLFWLLVGSRLLNYEVLVLRILYFLQSTLLPPSAPRVGGILGAAA